jgi:hypothetical protein
MKNSTIKKTIGNRQSKQQFVIFQVIDDGNGGQYEMEIGALKTGDVGLISGETLYGKLVVRQPETTAGHQ